MLENMYALPNDTQQLWWKHINISHTENVCLVSFKLSEDLRCLDIEKKNNTAKFITMGYCQGPSSEAQEHQVWKRDILKNRNKQLTYYKLT